MGTSELLKVELLNFKDLPEDERRYAPNNGCGKEYANYIRVSYDGKALFFESDAMEPEDATFRRDLCWITDALVACYGLGQTELREALQTTREPDKQTEVPEFKELIERLMAVVQPAGMRRLCREAAAAIYQLREAVDCLEDDRDDAKAVTSTKEMP